MISPLSTSTSLQNTLASLPSAGLSENNLLNGQVPGLNQTAGQSAPSQESDATREAFNKFVGGTFYRQLLTTMQKSVKQPAYFNGGHAEEMFRQELNSQLADTMAASTSEQFTGPMFDLFQLQRS